ncbi:siphovirus ReqiPepy6 Gp37-like family protein [Caproicibacter fermentans]|uniref:Siphovirus ReqiPepy6 Gp37-like family protein n=1 Tax=Caproicibacter fermentans TaxID=2576756 RepID=A0A7G8TDX9_9FIRM|nr:siphovirus ReqiPepy6 Gp37-like family protein [Caproicibacter fermentans]QNK41820.1 siphovirus ReqiPepy6 Gp37-like family protein [Caproicibacter fermentans]
MDLYIYGPDIEQLGVLDSFASLRWRRRYFEPGEFELHCPVYQKLQKGETEPFNNLSLIWPGNIIHRLDRKEAGIIEGVSIETPEGSTSEEITATGRMGSSMLDQRVVTPTLIFSGAVEDAMRKAVSDNAISARPLPHLTLGSAAGYAPTCSFQATGKTALTVCTALSKASTLGFRARLDVPGRAWAFEVYQGVDRSIAQHALPRVLFSDEYSNIKAPKYEINTTGYANYAYVAGEGEGADRVIVEVDQTNGEPRRELWVDARDLQKGEDMTDDQYREQLRQRGLEKLAEASKAENFSADAVDTLNYQYLTDWDLGDVVSMEKWGIRLDQRVTEVEEVYENGIETITPVCGTPLPEKLDFGSD